MTRRIIAFMLTCLTVLAAAVLLSACAPQPAEPTLGEKIKDAVILEYKGGETSADLTIENLVPAANSQEVASCLDKLRTNTGQTDGEGNPIYEYDFDHIKEVLQGDVSTVDDAQFNAFIIAFTEMSDEDKETFLESAYVKTEQGGLFGSSYKWDVSPVLGGMAGLFKSLLENVDVPNDITTNQKNIFFQYTFSYSLIKQLFTWGAMSSDSRYKNLLIDIERIPDMKWDATLSIGYVDEMDNTQTAHTVEMYQFWYDLLYMPQNIANKELEKKLIEDGRLAKALCLSAAINIMPDGNYSINAAYFNTFKLNIALRAYALEHSGRGSDGLGYTAKDILDAFKNDLFDNFNFQDIVEWYYNNGAQYISKYEKALESAYIDFYRSEFMSTNKITEFNAEEQRTLEQEAKTKLSELTYQQMKNLELNEDCRDYFEF